MTALIREIATAACVAMSLTIGACGLWVELRGDQHPTGIALALAFFVPALMVIASGLLECLTGRR
jgi:hypothetical protein